MFQAYLDESGINDSAGVCVVAGYTGSVSKWRKFERRWNRLLCEFGVNEFHAQRFWSYQNRGAGKRASPYNEWSGEKAHRFEEDAFSIIENTRIAPVAAAVPTADWNELTVQQRHFLTGGDYDAGSHLIASPGAPKKSYYLGLLGCIWAAAGHAKGGSRMHFVLDENDQLAPYAVSLFNKLRSNAVPRVRQRLGQISFGSSRQALPLQAADILAHQFFRHTTNSKAKGSFNRNPILERLLSGLKSKYDIPLYDSQGLRLLLSEIFDLDV